MRIYEAALGRYVPEERGCCVSCGFLAKHRERWHEASPKERANGYLSSDAGTGYGREINVRIACFRHQFPLAQEFTTALESIPEQPDDPESGHKRICAANLVVIRRKRNCPEWYPYIPGLSPKEHREEVVMMELEQDRKDFELRLSQIESTANRRLTNLTRIAIGLAVAALIIAAAGVVFTALAYFHSLGSGPMR